MLEIFDRHHHRLHMYCLKIVGNRQAAEDLTQEGWLRLVRYLRSGKRVDSPIALMLTIVRNLCLNHLRLERTHRSLDDLQPSEHPLTVAEELTHMQELVALSLPKLPMRQREVLVLHAYSGYTFEQIADMLGEQVGSVRMRASRARAHLARIVSAMVEIEEDAERHGGESGSPERPAEQWKGTKRIPDDGDRS